MRIFRIQVLLFYVKVITQYVRSNLSVPVTTNVLFYILVAQRRNTIFKI